MMVAVMFTYLYSCFLFGSLSLWKVSSGTDLTDVTAHLFPGGTPNKIVLAAYGDYNADKLVDIFVLGDYGKKLDILLATENKAYSRKNLLTLKKTVTSVIPADFNGDALMDVLITTPAGTEDNVNISVCWGTDENHQQGLGPPTFIMEAKNQPTLFDYNGDMLPDLLFEGTEEKRIVITFTTYKNFTRSIFNHEEDASPLSKKQANAFIDIDGNYMADLVLCTEGGYEIWINEGGQFHHNYTIEHPVGDDYIIGQAGFSDINQDGLANMLVPVCKRSTTGGGCTESAIYGLSRLNDTLKLVYNDFSLGGKTWQFTPPSDKWPEMPMALRFGDYNTDGFPDLILFLQTIEEGKSEPVKKAVLFQNIPCKDSGPCLLNRTFAPDVDNEINSYEGALVGSFFDLYEDGVLDILLVTVTEDRNATHTTSKPVLRAIRQTSTTDTCFMKVTVTNGLCYKDCLDNRQPYGVNVAGPVVRFSTISVNGDKQTSSATQLSQSSHFSLQLPYVMFGLGMTPNFVDTVGVGIPVLDKMDGIAQQREWTQIIPNSQLVVIPFPNKEPDRWIVKLFVTPSQSVLITGAALLGTCGFVAGIIGIFHWQERREDMKEKRQESHKFHFDAM